MTQPLQELLTVDQLAAWLQLPKATVYNYTYERKIPFLKIGPRLRFDRKQVEAWIHEREHSVAKR